MSDPLHDQKVEKVIFTDRNGKPRTRYKVAYSRSQVLQAQLEKERLGIFVDYAPVDVTEVTELFESRQLRIQAPYEVAATIVSTVAHRDKRDFKVLTGADILQTFQGREEENTREGFSAYPLLYIFLDYFEGPNLYLPQLVSELIGQRFHKDRHVWLFMPGDLESLARRWDNPGVLSLNYLPAKVIRELPGVSKETSPAATFEKQVRPVQVTDRGASTEDRKVAEDPKFKDRKKRWGK